MLVARAAHYLDLCVTPEALAVTQPFESVPVAETSVVADIAFLAANFPWRASRRQQARSSSRR